ncbi:hypothetical protein AC578_6456 [Pseudocercospora eumusae]|uniref:Uncharacterized protein n=1 Tax=Pseudocercospora eumusae TaxID=321146 RepID=A0A139HCW5_9PEZI|nr:hypothetical protein AC578_6456 [Pseudocercospora eumusae]
MAMQRRDPQNNGAPGPNWSHLDKNSGCPHKCCGTNDNKGCSACCNYDPNDPSRIHTPKTSNEHIDPQGKLKPAPCMKTHSC